MAAQITSKIVREVMTIDENRTALEAAVLMTEKFIGSVVVTGTAGIRGLFTERDLMMRVVGQKRDPADVLLKDVMSKDLVKIAPDDSPAHCLKLMKDARCRHLLVFNDDKFSGIVSLRDIVAHMIDEKEDLIKQLETYITS